jgi:hypothetical protein
MSLRAPPSRSQLLSYAVASGNRLIPRPVSV